MAQPADAAAIARIVAWAGCGPYRNRPCYAGVAEFSVYVSRVARGTGAGRAALGALIAACTARGFWKLVSRVFPENASVETCGCSRWSGSGH